MTGIDDFRAERMFAMSFDWFIDTNAAGDRGEAKGTASLDLDTDIRVYDFTPTEPPGQSS